MVRSCKPFKAAVHVSIYLIMGITYPYSYDMQEKNASIVSGYFLSLPLSEQGKKILIM